MNYLKWNNAIGKWLFNEENAEKEVYLFITRHDIVKIGREYGLNGEDEEIFDDYINALREGVPGRPSQNNIIIHALYAYKKWKEKNKKEPTAEFPLYLNYISLFVLPLTEDHNHNLRSDAYYPRINRFLSKYNLPSLPYQNESMNLNVLWEDLEEWSIDQKNTELGYFELHPFTNSRWVYVGKPLSQSILPLQAIRNLPQFFEICGLVPDDEIDSSKFRNLLSANGARHLGLGSNVINIIKDPGNELGQSIINIVKKNFQEWTGNTDQYDKETETTKKGNTIAQLRLCVEGDNARGYRTYYRLFSKLDFPEDLTFTFENREFKCQQFGKGWSKPLSLPFKEGLVLQDKLNKWHAKFPEKEVRLFIEGKNFHLSGWIEVLYMVTSRMLLLAKEEHSASIEEWGELFSNGGFRRIKGAIIADDLALYEIYNPQIEHPDFPLLQFKTDKRIKLSGGMKIGMRTWHIDFLPDVTIEYGLGTERVFIKYEDSDDKIPLKLKYGGHPIWEIPQNIEINKGFYIKVDYENVKGDQLRNYIIDTHDKLDKLSEEDLPARDKFGQIFNEREKTEYALGVSLITKNERTIRTRQDIYYYDFRPKATKCGFEINASDDFNKSDDLLVTYLTVKGKSNVKDYYEYFESVYQFKFDSNEIDSMPIELSKLKRWSLNYLDYMGFLDYEYSTKKIVINPPQFILIPTLSGRKVLLIGGRTPELIHRIKGESDKEGLNFLIEQQDSSLFPFILPPTITVAGFDEVDGKRLESKLKKLAEACSILFNIDKFPQFRLVDFSGSISEYGNQLIPDERFDDSGWPARVFNTDQLNFLPVGGESIDKNYSLVEYRLTEYNYKHRLWINGLSYDVNKNWARYMVLKHDSKEIVYNDREKRIVAIPATLPLPRLLSKALTLFSGKAPMRKHIELDGFKSWFNIFENLPHVIAYNSILQVDQKMKEVVIDL